MKLSQNFEADYVVVGGGTAGCIVAARLAEDADNQVVLVEAGPKDRSPLLHIPIGFSKLLHNQKMTWGYKTTAQANLNGRCISWPRGKVLGGCSSINGMVWVRGNDLDFNEWARLTKDSGWSWSEVQYYFKKLEAASGCEDDRLGRSGQIPLTVTKLRNKSVEAFIAAGEQQGLTLRTGMAISDQTGVGYYLTTTKNGRRVSSARAFLWNSGGKKNLTVLTNTRVSKVLFDDSNVAVAVCAHRGGNTFKIQSRRGIVLTAGAINSPHLLMLSGIGQSEQLKRQGIPVRWNSREVGRNLRDHLGVRVITRIKPSITVNNDFKRPWRLLKYGLQYAISRTGPLSMGGAYAGAFFSTGASRRPSMQIHFLPLSMKGEGWDFHRFAAVTANVCQLRPESVGDVSLETGDYRDAPRIDPNYLLSPADQTAMVAGVRFVRNLFQSPAFTGPMEPKELAPGTGVQKDEDILEFIRENSSTVFHPVGTCRMGSDAVSVVTPEGRVRGTQRLWIADASIMPTIPSGNTNAATAVIAERVSDFIREKKASKGGHHGPMG